MYKKFLLTTAILFLAGCEEQTQTSVPEEQKPPLVLTQKTFADLPAWGTDDLQSFIPAFEKSCTKIAAKMPDEQFGVMPQAGTYGDWQSICLGFAVMRDRSAPEMKKFIEENFTPYAVSAGDNPQGLFTGYYEASLKGSREKTDIYSTPLYARPDDLVMVDLGQFREELKGQRIAGRVQDGNLKPYESRAEIVAGNWPHNDKVLLWVDDPVDAFFLQIQGSGIVTLPDNTTARIGYAGQNGHPYYAIGKELIQRGELTKETVSMQSIRTWLEAHPQEADEIMNTNKSYVFFQESKEDGAVGAQGVPLTPERSLAVDRTLISYGIPLWVDIEKPAEDEEKITKLMLAQDTGGAITGAVRGDVFWGYGQHAENVAGIMKSKGQYWALLPKKENQ